MSTQPPVKKSKKRPKLPASQFFRNRRMGQSPGEEDKKMAGQMEEKALLQEIEEEKYYHGVLPREDIVQMLDKDGDYLLRRIELEGKFRIVITVKWNAEPFHVLLNRTRQGYWTITDQGFESVPDLLNYYRKNKTPVTAEGALLKTAILRQHWQVNHDNIFISKKLGSGAFGEVFKGKLKQEKGTRVPVAIKTLHNLTPNKNEKENLVQEARVMLRLRHKNIIQIHGVAAQENPILIVMELMDGGSLRKFLIGNGHTRSLTEHIRYCIDGARGMSYLESKGIIHRDVACRNCLLGENMVVKISDFGFSLSTDFYKAAFLKGSPIKWLAPETLAKFEFSTKSDVWSFGIVIWEVFSDGDEPYPSLSNTQVRQKLCTSKVQAYRMEPPYGTPFAIRELLNQAWNEDPQARPNFSYIHKTLQRAKDELAELTYKQ